MLLTRQPDDIAGSIFFQHGNPECGVYLGVHPVAFGYRVVIHPMDDCSIWGNYCAGNSQENLEEMYGIFYGALSEWREPVDKNSVINFCRSLQYVEQRRPWGNDPKFQQAVRNLCPDAAPFPMPDKHLFRTLTNNIHGL